MALRPVDGGDGFYQKNGFANAAAAGWDTAVFPLGIWDSILLSQADADRWIDLGLVVTWASDNVDFSLFFPANPIYQVGKGGNPPYQVNGSGGLGAETLGLLAADEPPFQETWTSVVAETPNADQDGRYWWCGFTWDQFLYGENVENPPPSTYTFPQVLTTQVQTPDGSFRQIDVTSVDIYWFSGAVNNSLLQYLGGQLYGLSRLLTNDECMRACHYGDMIDLLRSNCTALPAGNGAGSKPLQQIVENGGITTDDTVVKTTTVASGSNGGSIASIASWSSPSAGVLDVASGTGFNTTAGTGINAAGSTVFVHTSTGYAQVVYTGSTSTSLTGCTWIAGATGTVSTGATVYECDYITPPQMNQAIWSSIIHGARQISYFNNTFAGPAQTADNFAAAYYQAIQPYPPGNTISIYNQAKATNALIGTLTPVLLSPFVTGYVTVTPPATVLSATTADSGIEVMAKYYTGGGVLGNGFYIFADTRESLTVGSITATFTVEYLYDGPVTVVNESRTVTAANGVFADVFADATTVHIYYIPGTLMPTLVQDVHGTLSNQNTSLVITPGATTTAGNLLAICGWYFDNNHTLAVSDSSGTNTWTIGNTTATGQDPPVGANGSSATSAFVAWCTDAAPVTSVTITNSGGGSTFWTAGATLSEWNGATALSSSSGASGASGTVAPGTLTLATASDVVIGAANEQFTATGTPETPMAAFPSDASGYTAYAQPGAAGSFAPAWDTGQGHQWAGAAAAFTPPAPPSGGKTRTRASIPSLITTL